jgi:hypothetical protein
MTTRVAWKAVFCRARAIPSAGRNGVQGTKQQAAAKRVIEIWGSCCRGGTSHSPQLSHCKLQAVFKVYGPCIYIHPRLMEISWTPSCTTHHGWIHTQASRSVMRSIWRFSDEIWCGHFTASNWAKNGGYTCLSFTEVFSCLCLPPYNSLRVYSCF